VEALGDVIAERLRSFAEAGATGQAPPGGVANTA